MIIIKFFIALAIYAVICGSVSAFMALCAMLTINGILAIAGVTATASFLPIWAVMFVVLVLKTKLKVTF